MLHDEMFAALEKINQRPKPYEYYTTPLLWNDPYISKKMLEIHLNEKAELASRPRKFIEQSAEWMSSRFYIGKETKICDFGCGPGLYTMRFAGKGAKVTGIDLSERSIDYAKKVAKQNNLKIEYILQNYLQFSTDKRFDLITMIYCDFCVLNPEQRKILLKKFYDLLEPNGTVFLDVSSLKQFTASKEQRSYEYSSGNGFWSGSPHYVFHNTFKYDNEKLLLDKYTIIEESQIRENYCWLQCYSIQSVKKEFKQSGFNVIEHYSNVAGASHESNSTEIAIVANK